MSVDGSDDKFGSVFESQQCFVGVQAKVVLEGRVDAGQHFYIRAGREELVAYASEDDHVDVVIHAGFEDGIVKLTVHLVGVGVSRRVVHLNHSNARISAVVNELFGGFSGGGLDSGSHEFLLQASFVRHDGRRRTTDPSLVLGFACGRLGMTELQNVKRSLLCLKRSLLAMSPMRWASSSALPSTRGLYQV